MEECKYVIRNNKLENFVNDDLNLTSLMRVIMRVVMRVIMRLIMNVIVNLIINFDNAEASD